MGLVLEDVDRLAGPEIDGKAVFGHNDGGKKAPDPGWRFTDAWLSMAGAVDKGIPTATR